MHDPGYDVVMRTKTVKDVARDYNKENRVDFSQTRTLVGYFPSKFCRGELEAAKEAGVPIVPVFSGEVHTARHHRWPRLLHLLRLLHRRRSASRPAA